MMNKMQTAYIRIIRKIKQKSDGSSAIAKDLVQEGVDKLVSNFSDDPGIIEASRKLYSTAIKTYKTPSPFIAEIAKDGAALLHEKFGKTACGEIYHLYSSAIIQYLRLKEDTLAKSLTDEAVAFFTQNDCPEQAANIPSVLEDPRSKSDIKLF